MFRRLRKKFIVLNMTMMSLAVVASFLTIYWMMSNETERQNDLKMENASSSALSQMNNPDAIYSQILVTDSASEYYLPYFSALLDEDNHPIFRDSASEETKNELTKLIDLALNSNSDQVEIDQRRYQFSIVSAFAQVSVGNELSEATPEIYRLITFIDITDSQNTLHQLLLAFVIIGGVLLGVIFLISVFFAKKSVAPIETSYLQQKQFIADASHELKTPVASIRANIEAIASNPDEPVSNQKKWMEYIHIELDRMGKLIGDLLSLARYDTLQSAVTMATVNLSDMIQDIVLQMEAFAFERGIGIHPEIEDSVVAVLDAEKYEQIIRILLDNAVKYVNESGRIDLSLRESKNHVIFEISNTGEGIAPEYLDKIFDRFYRVDVSRENNGSYGLGLSIAKTLLDQMHGKIAVKSVLGESTTFTVTIPK